MRETKIENFKAKFQERWRYPSEDKYDELLRLWPEGENPEAEKAVKKLREKSWRVDKAAERDLVLEENIKWLSKKNPELSPAQARTLVSRYDSIPSLIFYDKSEYHLFSFYTANEFLAQEIHERYGDFLDENWDKLYGLMREGYFTLYGHTSRLFGLFTEKDSVLLHRPRSSKAVQDALENLTREDFSKLTKIEARKLKASATLLPEHIKSLLVDEKPQVYKQDVLKDKLYAGFSKAVAASGAQPGWSHLKLAHLLLKYIERIDRSFYENDRYAKPGKLPNSVLKPIADLIEKRGEEFMPYEILGVVFILTSPDAVISAPKLHGLRAFIPFPEVEEVDQRQVLKLMGKLAVSYRGRIPTLAAWEKFLKSGDAALAMDHELMFELMGGPDVLRGNILSKDLMEFRGSLPR